VDVAGSSPVSRSTPLFARSAAFGCDSLGAGAPQPSPTSRSADSRHLPVPRPSLSRANAAVRFRLRSWYESSVAPMAAAGGSRFFGPRHAERVADGGDRFPLVLADMFATDPQDTALPRGLGHHLRDG